MTRKKDGILDIISAVLNSIDLTGEQKKDFQILIETLNKEEKAALNSAFKNKNDAEINYILDVIINCVKNQNLLNILYGYLTDDKHMGNYEFNNDIHGYYFLFKKNLRVTNIQFPELISLIRRNATQDDKAIGNELLFLHIKELKELTEGFYNSIYQIIENENFNKIKRQSGSFWQFFFKLFLYYESDNSVIKYNPIILFNLITEKYNDLILKTVFVDYFHSSCIIYLPKSITLNLKQICAYSGYINSCGNLIYVKNVEKAQKDIFVNNLRSYCDSLTKQSKFAVFSHEDSIDEINTQDTNNPLAHLIRNDLKSGLNDVKVYLEKFHMGDDSLIDVINELCQKAKKGDIKLFVPEIDNLQWREIREEKTDSTIWFHIEHSTGEKDLTKPGKLRYYICYEQLYKNENQIHIFDENKPAWKSCTTIPHTLVGAMFNIALQYLPLREERIRVLDPFLGTGTSLIESLKFSNIDFYGYDLDKLSPILIEDNIELLFDPKIESILNTFDFDINETIRKKLGKLVTDFQIEFNSYKKGEYDIQELDINQNNLIEKFRSEEIQNRLLIYLLFKTNIKNSGALSRQTNVLIAGLSHTNLIQKESNILKAQLIELESLLKDCVSDPEDEALLNKKGKFSNKLLFDKNFITRRFKEYKQNSSYGIKDALKINANNYEGKKFDFIITDPPYGFNVSHKNLELAELFNDFIDVFLDNLADNGQILMALPEKSYSGKRSPYFTHKEIVIKNFILKAPKKGFEVINTAEILPHNELFRPPYYWEAEKALRRSIIHLRFRKIRN